MKRLSVMIFAAVMCLGISACGSSTDSANSGTSSSSPQSLELQQAIDALHGVCTESDEELVKDATGAAKLMAKRGITDETQLTMLQHLRESIPADAPKLSCLDQMGSYVNLRAPGSAVVPAPTATTGTQAPIETTTVETTMQPPAEVDTPQANVGPANGQPCDDVDKLAYDPAAGVEIVCSGTAWGHAPDTTGVHTTGTSCDDPAIPPYMMSTSDEGYLITCESGTWTLYAP